MYIAVFNGVTAMTQTQEIFIAQVISLGRITIPDKVRNVLDIKDGDYVRVTIEKIKV
jgi:AbrB family looped-hinge helix DNA binding protein